MAGCAGVETYYENLELVVWGDWSPWFVPFWLAPDNPDIPFDIETIDEVLISVRMRENILHQWSREVRPRTTFRCPGGSPPLEDNSCYGIYGRTPPLKQEHCETGTWIDDYVSRWESQKLFRLSTRGRLKRTIRRMTSDEFSGEANGETIALVRQKPKLLRLGIRSSFSEDGRVRTVDTRAETVRDDSGPVAGEAGRVGFPPPVLVVGDLLTLGARYDRGLRAEVDGRPWPGDRHLSAAELGIGLHEVTFWEEPEDSKFDDEPERISTVFSVVSPIQLVAPAISTVILDGDSATIDALVHNRSDSDQFVAISLADATAGWRVTLSANGLLQLEPDESRVIEVRIERAFGLLDDAPLSLTLQAAIPGSTAATVWTSASITVAGSPATTPA